MATQKQALSATAATDLSASFSLIDGEQYTLQVQGGIAHVAEMATAPDLSDSGLAFRRYRDGDEFPYVAASGSPLYGWGSGRIICDDG